MSRHPNIGKKNVTVSPNWGKIVTVSQNRRKIVTVSQNPKKKSLSTLMQPRTDHCASVGKTQVVYTVEFAESWLVLFRRGLSSHLQSSAARAVSFRFVSCVFSRLPIVVVVGFAIMGSFPAATFDFSLFFQTYLERVPPTFLTARLHAVCRSERSKRQVGIVRLLHIFFK